MNEQKKTVRDWLNELPEPIRTRALKNLDVNYANLIRGTIEDALFLFCDWTETTEGSDYWYLVNICNYSKACALLGETLQTEQTKDLELTESEFFDLVADKVATEQYNKFWFELDDSQKAHLVKPIAIRYAELVNNQKQ